MPVRDCEKDTRIKSEEHEMNNQFAGKVAVVAGGTGGLGKAVSLAFLDEGAKVVVSQRSDEEFTALQAMASARGSSVDGQRVDVTDEATVREWIGRVVAEYGRVDVLVNAIGGYVGGVKLWEIESETFERMISLNLRAGYLLARMVTPVMLKQNSGAIVNVLSKAAVDHAAGAAAYAASKAAALAMTDCLAADLKGTGVRVNSILPTIIDTEGNRRAMPTADFAKWPKPEEIARVILFLCSDEAKLVNGAAVAV
jgi:NAD(P)-dependent dehydrogenase (short-subunit alcohol dehydrogenase family)